MTPQPTITGILETAIYVSDLPTAVSFYTRLLGFEIEVSDDYICVMRVVPGQVFILFPRAIADMPGRTSSPAGTVEGMIPAHGGTGRLHAAFAIPTEELPAWEKKVLSMGLVIEGRVQWKRGGCSLYFRDPDGNLLELVTPGLWSSYAVPNSSAA